MATRNGQATSTPTTRHNCEDSEGPLRRSGETLAPDELAHAQATFLDAYAKRGNVRAAAAAAHVHRSTVYRWQEHDPDFDAAYHQAQADYRDALRDEIDRRARRDVLSPVFGAEGKVGMVRKYSDTLLIFQAKAHMPEYREKTRIEMSGPDGGPMQTAHTLDLGALQAVLLTALANYPEAQYAAAAALAQLADHLDGAHDPSHDGPTG